MAKKDTRKREWEAGNIMDWVQDLEIQWIGLYMSPTRVLGRGPWGWDLRARQIAIARSKGRDIDTKNDHGV